MKTVYVYALTDPDTEEVCYIGRTVNPYKRNLAHGDVSLRWDKSPKAKWMAELKAQGKTPNMHVLEACAFDGWQEGEQRWISHYRKVGAPLLNKKMGGGGYMPGAPLSYQTPTSEKARRSLVVTIGREDFDFLTEYANSQDLPRAGIVRQLLEDFITSIKEMQK